MATAADFLNNPETFMQTNIVQVTTPDPSSVPANAPVRVTVAPTQLKVANTGGEVFELYITNDPNKPAIDAYFCPYQNDKSFFIMLGNAADYMFTPKMDGCSFGIGSQAHGACRVGHVNFTAIQNDWRDSGYDVASDRMYSAQRNFLTNRLGIGTGRVVDPTDYRGGTGTGAATTYGKRSPGQVWSFYTLRYSKPGSRTYLHEGIHLHVNN